MSQRRSVAPVGAIFVARESVLGAVQGEGEDPGCAGAGVGGEPGGFHCRAWNRVMVLEF